MNKKELLKQCFLFSGLDDSIIFKLEKIVLEKKVYGGEMLFLEGEPADSFFVLAEGRIDLVKNSIGGREQLIKSVKVGDMFAEVVAFSGEDYPATAISREQSLVFYIKTKTFLDFLKNYPQVSLKMIGGMAKLLRHLNNLVSDLSLGSVTSRLAKYLVEQTKITGTLDFELDIRKKELAQKINTVGETLSRNLKKMEEDGLILVQNRRILIKDIKQLENLALKLT